MTVLSDIDITNYMDIDKLDLDPFNQKNLTPNGYDLTIEEIFIKKTNEHVKEGVAVIPPFSWFAISTKEFVKMSDKITAQLWIRSSYARKGIMASFGKVDAGFHGTLTISCFNATDEKIDLPIGDRFCQIVFEKLESLPAELYDKKSGNYQNQRGVTLKR
jgi:dCTP deaminase